MFPVEFEGLRELQRAAKRSTDTELPRRLGEAHREIGRLVISKLSPKPDPMAVGMGRGAAIRPSATKREVVLRVGGGHRASGEHTRKQPWGVRRVGRIGSVRPPRPYIRGTVEQHHDEISTKYLEAVSRAMSGAFHKTDP